MRRWHHLHYVHEFIRDHYDPMHGLPKTRLEIWEVRPNEYRTEGQYSERSSRIILWLGRDPCDQVTTVVHEIAHHVAYHNGGTREPHDKIWHDCYFKLAEWMGSLGGCWGRRPMWQRYHEAVELGMPDGMFGHGIADALVDNTLWAAGWVHHDPRHERQRRVA